MTINKMKALSIAESKEIIEGEDKEIKGFLKKFVKLDIKKAREFREELENLDLMKVKEENIVKIIDLLPEDSMDINKIFVDVSLDENEVNKILEVVKKYS
jgi:DNA-directed RNA polymerase subunit F